jgi:hypothetical protein
LKENGSTKEYIEEQLNGWFSKCKNQAGRVAPVVGPLPSKCEVLSSIPNMGPPPQKSKTQNDIAYNFFLITLPCSTVDKIKSVFPHLTNKAVFDVICFLPISATPILEFYVLKYLGKFHILSSFMSLFTSCTWNIYIKYFHPPTTFTKLFSPFQSIENNVYCILPYRFLKAKHFDWAWCLMLIIPTTWKAEIERIMVQDKLGHKVFKSPISRNTPDMVLYICDPSYRGGTERRDVV